MPDRTSADAVPEDLVVRAREAFDHRRWPEAAERYAAADAVVELGHEDLERLAVAFHLVGADRDGDEARTRAHQVAVRHGDLPAAARHAIWLGLGLALRGEGALAGGWFGRAQRLLDECGAECVERGYLLVPGGMQALDANRPDVAGAVFEDVGAVAARYGDADLTAFARIGLGQARVLGGDASGGLALLDEAMVTVVANEVSPIVAGVVYCAAIETCQRAFDSVRARAWTDALSRWCDAQPGLVPYRGQCLVHRSQVLTLQGRWSEAIDEADRARAQLSRPTPQPAVGAAWYQRGELQRLRGAVPEAERSYREAAQAGHDPQPGLALLRLAQGDGAAAGAALRRAVGEASDACTRARYLPAFVEALLATGDVASARAAAAELGALARDLAAPLLDARAAHANGAVLLAEGEPAAALEVLRGATRRWHELDAPYEAARSRWLIAAACRALGDRDTADVEAEAASRVFARLGARPDQALPTAAAGADARSEAGRRLTSRELEVLRLVSTGAATKQVAASLGVSARTVDRHLSNIFTKLGVSSRTAATAWAYEHGVV